MCEGRRCERWTIPKEWQAVRVDGFLKHRCGPDHMLRSSQEDTAERPVALEDSMPPPRYISRTTVMRSAMTKRSKKETARRW